MGKSYLSPRDLARAIGVSESSVKRWIDDGQIAVVRTTGGHRRIAPHEAVRFVRQSNLHVADPKILGFLDARKAAGTPEESLFEALRAGRRDQVLALIQGWFLAGRSAAWILDGPVASAMARIGALWKHGPEGIVQEHRATDLCIQALTQLRLALPPARADAPLAIGAAPSRDPYVLASLGAALVAQEAGMRAVNLGPETPLAVLRDAAVEQQAALVWLSISTAEGAASAKADLLGMVRALAPGHAQIVVGGRFARDLEPTYGTRVVFARGLAELAAFARGLLAGHAS